MAGNSPLRKGVICRRSQLPAGGGQRAEFWPQADQGGETGGGWLQLPLHPGDGRVRRRRGSSLQEPGRVIRVDLHQTHQDTRPRPLSHDFNIGDCGQYFDCLLQIIARGLDLILRLRLSSAMYEKIGSPEPSTCAKVIRAFSIAAGVLLIAFGIVGLIYMILHDIISARFFLIFSPVFIILFGIVMVAVEFRVGIVMESFDFLGSLMGKGIFYIYLSSVVFFYFSCGVEGSTVLAWILSMIIFGLGVVFVILNCCSSDYNNDVRERLN